MNEGAVSAELGLAGWPAVAEEAIIARDVLLAEARRRAAARLPRLDRRQRRHRPLGQGARHRRHRRGHPAPPAADRRARARLRRPLQGEPAAAPRRGRAGPARRPRRRHDRHRRHRPRAAPARVEGVRLAGGQLRHGRPRERPERRAAGGGRHRGAVAGRTSRGCSRATPAAIGRLDGYDAPFAVGSPAHRHPLRPGGARASSASSGCTARASTRRTSAASCPAGRRHDPRRRADGARRRPARARGGGPWIGSCRPSSSSRSSPLVVRAAGAELARTGAAGRPGIGEPASPPADLGDPDLHRRPALRRDDARRRPARPDRDRAASASARGAVVTIAAIRASCSISPGAARSSSRRPRSAASAAPPGRSTASSTPTA